jgi:DNA-binding response OmpR family regulator
MSGHTFDSLDQGALDPAMDCFMAKPFAPDALKATVDKMLRERAPNAERETA